MLDIVIKWAYIIYNSKTPKGGRWEVKTITIQEVIELRKAKHAVYGYILRNIVSVDGYKQYKADRKTCMVANAPDSELDLFVKLK